MNWALMTVALVAALLLILQLWSRSDVHAVDTAWRDLIRKAPIAPTAFDPAMIADLPEPARRFFTGTIRPGTPLLKVAEVTMHGELSLGTKSKHTYWPMRACQILAAPEGFIWEVATGRTPFGLAGSDGALDGSSWTRFWMAGVLPVARVGGNRDHLRSSFGRYIADASFWTPAALMPSDTVLWEALDVDVARVTVSHGDFVQAVDLTLDSRGHPVQVVFERWSDANADKVHRLQQFGGELTDFREFDGFTVPTRVVAGNHFGTDEYFPFFKATVDNVRFILSPDDSRGCHRP